MSLERLKKAKRKTVGSKQTAKAIQANLAKVVYLAHDAEQQVKRPLQELCQQKGVDAVIVATMIELGKACGIEVGSAAAAVIED